MTRCSSTLVNHVLTWYNFTELHCIQHMNYSFIGRVYICTQVYHLKFKPSCNSMCMLTDDISIMKQMCYMLLFIVYLQQISTTFLKTSSHLFQCISCNVAKCCGLMLGTVCAVVCFSSSKFHGLFKSVIEKLSQEDVVMSSLEIRVPQNHAQQCSHQRTLSVKQLCSQCGKSPHHPENSIPFQFFPMEK